MHALQSARPLRGTCSAPGDKSISHRAAILAAMAHGASRIRGYSTAGDCRATLGALRALGTPIERRGHDVIVTGPLDLTARDVGCLDCRRSGTTMRLLAGVVAGTQISAELTGDPQLLRRPMARVAEPLREMGARVELVDDDRPPVTIRGGVPLHGITYELPVASAQVKSAILLAGLRAQGTTTVIERVPTRDHTERILRAMGAAIDSGDSRVSVTASELEALDVSVPGDLSSAAFLLAGAALSPGSDVTVEGVGLNPTRTGFLDVVSRMGAALEVEPVGHTAGGERFGRVRVRYAPLRATTVEPDEVPRLIDELPLVALLATQAEGTTEIRGAAELRAKESDRIAGLATGLRGLGADVEELPDGLLVHGPTPLRGGTCDALGDHRLVATFAIAGLTASGPVHVLTPERVSDSFPSFDRTLAELMEASG
jgi:3-phosphoshikimate 1-carboxyvinyltransferase